MLLGEEACLNRPHPPPLRNPSDLRPLRHGRGYSSFAFTYTSFAVVQLATSASKFIPGSAKRAVAVANRALRVQGPIIVIGAVAPLFCLIDNMTVKLAFAAVHFVTISCTIAGFGVVNVMAFGMVIKETNKIANKDAGLVKAVKRMKLLKREVASQCVQNTCLALLFGFWPFLQVRAAWNIAIAYPIVLHCIVIPLATLMLWPAAKKKVEPTSSSDGSSSSSAYLADSSPDTKNAETARPPAGRRPSFSGQHSVQADTVLRDIVATQKEEMLVVPMANFLAHGKIPRSNEGATRPRRPDDIVVFVSHRWWGNNHPDDTDQTKFGVICRALARLASQKSLDQTRVAVWMDFACIEQDDLAALQRGVDSLLAYCARSDYLLIPTRPKEDAIENMRLAQHPMDLAEYGERAWCRLEIYVFLCLSEMRREPLRCYCYGMWTRGRVTTETRRTGNRKKLFGLVSTSGERLQQLRGRGDIGLGTAFRHEHLPREGQLTNEDDRAVVAGIEDGVRDAYVAIVSRAEADRFASQHQSSSSSTLSLLESRSSSNQDEARGSPGGARRRTTTKLSGGFSGAVNPSAPNRRWDVNLAGKQLRCVDLNFVASLLSAPSFPLDRVRGLFLDHNRIADDGVVHLLQAVVRLSDARNGRLRHLSLRGNVVGVAGCRAIVDFLRNGSCQSLSTIDLSENGLGKLPGTQAAEALAGIFGDKSNLTELVVESNCFDESSVQILIDSMMARVPGTVYKIDEQGLSDKCMGAYSSAMMRADMAERL